MKTRKYSNKVAAVVAGIHRMSKQYAIVLDGADELQRVEVPADRPVGLLAGLMVRAGALAPLPPSPPVAPKPRRGRPVGSKKAVVV